MSVAGSSATGTWDQDQDVQLSSVNPMYNFVAHNVPSTYDEITQERMDRHSSPPPFQREQAAPGYLNRLPVQKAPTGFGEKLQLDTSEEMSSLCSGLLCVYVFAVLFLILSLVSLSLAFCLLLGVVSPVREMSPTLATGTTSSPTCNCPEVVTALELSAQLQNLQAAADSTMTQLKTMMNVSVFNSNLLHNRLNHVSSSLNSVELFVNNSKPKPLTANVTAPFISSNCTEEIVSKTCDTMSPYCPGELERFAISGTFTVSFQCQTTDGTTGEPVSSHKVVVSQRIIPIGSEPKFNLTLDVLLEGFSLCQCDYLSGADRNITCSAVIRRCPILHNFTNVIFKT